MRCTCAGIEPGWPQHEFWCGKPETGPSWQPDDLTDEDLDGMAAAIRASEERAEL